VIAAPARSALVVRRLTGAPVVALRLVLPGGSRREAIPGQALVAGRMLAEGTAQHDWHALADLAERRGMSVAGWASLESHGVAIDALASEWDGALALAAELVFASQFPADRLEWTARHAAAELTAQEDQADVLTARAFAEQLWAPHPKGRPLQGDAASLARLVSADCRTFHHAAVARGGWLVVAGEIDEDEVAAAAERRFAALAPARNDGFAPPAPPARAALRREVRTRARDQAHLFVGQRTIERRHADYEALELAAVALGAGAGLSGRIPNRVRDREGLAYVASADLVAGASLDEGRLTAYVATGPGNLELAERAVREELARFVAEGMTAEELANARSYLLGREPFRRETARLWADLAAHALVVGLPLTDAEWRRARLSAVELEAVHAALARHVDPDALAVTIGLPAES
jgi:zinc protease